MPFTPDVTQITATDSGQATPVVITIVGFGNAGDTAVTVYDNGVVIATGVPQGDGSFTISTSALDSTSHTITVTTTDLSSVESGAEPVVAADGLGTPAANLDVSAAADVSLVDVTLLTGPVSVTGNISGDTVFGNDAGDTVHAGNGGDNILTGAGNDLIYGGTGGDTIKSGSGDDTIHSGGNSNIDAGSGNDTIFAGGGDTIFGGAGDDSITGSATDAVGFGGGFADYLVQRTGANAWTITNKPTAPEYGSGAAPGADHLAGISTLLFGYDPDTGNQGSSVKTSDLVGVFTDSDGGTNQVDEGSAADTHVGVTANAVDGNGDTVTYTLVGDTSGGGFKVDSGTGLVTVADSSKINDDVTSSFTITVQATSADNSFTQQDFTIAIIGSTSNNLIATLDSTSVREDTPVHVTVTDSSTIVTASSYQWQIDHGSGFVNATGTGTTSATYTPTQGDEGGKLHVLVVYTSPGNGTETATSNTSDTVVDNSTLSVTIGGDAREGSTLTATPVVDSEDSGATVHYQWERSADGFVHITDIGTDSATYLLTEADEDSQVRVMASFTDITNQLVATVSTPTALVADIVPTLSVSVTGTAAVGQTLTAVAVANESDVTFSYQWQSSTDNGANWSDIASATAATYLVNPSDKTHELRVAVTSSDVHGNGTSADSSEIAIPNRFPAVTPASLNVPAISSQNFAASILFSASDPDGDPVISYQVRDDNADPASGFWVLNGAVLAANLLIDVTAAQLSELNFVAGSVSVGSISDLLEARASDDAGFGDFSSFTVTASQFEANDRAPVVTASDKLALAESSLAASSLFSASDPDGDTIVSYEVVDTTPNSGHWIFNGVSEPASQVLDVTAAQLSLLSFQSGFGTDTLAVRANDGAQWGGFTTFQIHLESNPSPPAGTTADMIMDRAADGLYEIYDIGSNAILAAYPLGQIDTGLHFVGLGGFSSADTTDMLLRDSNTGVFEVYDINNNNINNTATMGQVGLEWQPGGFGDFSSHAGETDIILRSVNTGGLEVYDISDNQFVNAAFLGQVGLELQIAGFGDFGSNPSETDMLMRNTNTGVFEFYDIANNHITNAGPVGQVGLEWQVAGFGDFSGRPGETDMLMRNTNTGAFEFYDIANNHVTNAGPMGQVGLEFQVAGFGEFSGHPGETDMIMRNINTGAFEFYDITNNQVIDAGPMGQVGLDFRVDGFAVDPPAASAAAAHLLDDHPLS